MYANRYYNNIFSLRGFKKKEEAGEGRREKIPEMVDHISEHKNDIGHLRKVYNQNDHLINIRLR